MPNGFASDHARNKKSEQFNVPVQNRHRTNCRLFFAAYHAFDFLTHEAFYQCRKIFVQPVLQHGAQQFRGDLIEGPARRGMNHMIQILKCCGNMALRRFR
ncbi:hypothetical protein DK68_3174 [Brucella suis]|nr:hypothetical protein DK68_3174 [Brucella suis]